MTIPRIPLIAVTPRRLNERLWELFALSAEGKATAAHERELDALCNTIEADQDNAPGSVPPIPVDHLKAIMKDKQL